MNLRLTFLRGLGVTAICLGASALVGCLGELWCGRRLPVICAPFLWTQAAHPQVPLGTVVTIFPYLYDFTSHTVLYYYPCPPEPGHHNTEGQRFFYRFDTGQIMSE